MRGVPFFKRRYTKGVSFLSKMVYKNFIPRPGGYFQKSWVGVCGTLLETVTLFQTKICDFPYPISDLIKNLIPYFRPALVYNFRSALVQNTYTVGVNIKREMVLSPYDEEVASSQKHTQFKTKVRRPNPFSDQNGQN